MTEDDKRKQEYMKRFHDYAKRMDMVFLPNDEYDPATGGSPGRLLPKPETKMDIAVEETVRSMKELVSRPLVNMRAGVAGNTTVFGNLNLAYLDWQERAGAGPGIIGDWRSDAREARRQEREDQKEQKRRELKTFTLEEERLIKQWAEADGKDPDEWLAERGWPKLDTWYDNFWQAVGIAGEETAAYALTLGLVPPLWGVKLGLQGYGALTRLGQRAIVAGTSGAAFEGTNALLDELNTPGERRWGKVAAGAAVGAAGSAAGDLAFQGVAALLQTARMSKKHATTRAELMEMESLEEDAWLFGLYWGKANGLSEKQAAQAINMADDAKAFGPKMVPIDLSKFDRKAARQAAADPKLVNANEFAFGESLGALRIGTQGQTSDAQSRFLDLLAERGVAVHPETGFMQAQGNPHEAAAAMVKTGRWRLLPAMRLPVDMPQLAVVRGVDDPSRTMILVPNAKADSGASFMVDIDQETWFNLRSIVEDTVPVALAPEALMRDARMMIDEALGGTAQGTETMLWHTTREPRPVPPDKYREIRDGNTMVAESLDPESHPSFVEVTDGKTLWTADFETDPAASSQVVFNANNISRRDLDFLTGKDEATEKYMRKVGDLNTGSWIQPKSQADLIDELINKTGLNRRRTPWAADVTEGARLAKITGRNPKAMKKLVEQAEMQPAILKAMEIASLQRLGGLRAMAEGNPEEWSRKQVRDFVAAWNATLEQLENARRVKSASGRTLAVNKAKVRGDESHVFDLRVRRDMMAEVPEEELRDMVRRVREARTVEDLVKNITPNPIDVFFDHFVGWWWKPHLLRGYKTAAINAVGNRLFSGAMVADRFAAGMAGHLGWGRWSKDDTLTDIILGNATDHPNNATVWEAGEMLEGMFWAFPEAIQKGGKAWWTEKPGGPLKYEEREPMLTRRVFEKYLPREAAIVASAASKWQRNPYALLAADDAFSSHLMRGAARRALARRAVLADAKEAGKVYGVGRKGVAEYREAVKAKLADPLFRRSIEKEVEELALYSTFRNELDEVGKMVMKARNWRVPMGKVPYFGHAVRIPAGEFLLPFTHSPHNIIKTGAVERTPMALARPKTYDDMAGGGAPAQTAVAKMFVGTGMMLWAGNMAMEGWINGRSPKNDAARERWYQSGRIPYSRRVQVGVDRWGEPEYHYIQFSRLEPWSFPFMFMADYWANYREFELSDEEFSEVGAHVRSGLYAATSTFQKSYYSGGLGFIDWILKPDQNPHFWRRFATSLVTSGGGKDAVRTGRFQWLGIPTGQGPDPYIREVETVWEGINARSPFLNMELPSKRNLWGEPIMEDQGWLFGLDGGDDIAGVYGSPIRVSRVAPDWVDRELIRLADELGIDEARQIQSPAIGSKKVHGIALNSRQFDLLQRLAGQFEGHLAVGREGIVSDYIHFRKKKDIFKEMMRSPAYKTASDLGRSVMLLDINRHQNNKAMVALVYGVWGGENMKLALDLQEKIKKKMQEEKDELASALEERALRKEWYDSGNWLKKVE